MATEPLIQKSPDIFFSCVLDSYAANSIVMLVNSDHYFFEIYRTILHNLKGFKLLVINFVLSIY